MDNLPKPGSSSGERPDTFAETLRGQYVYNGAHAFEESGLRRRRKQMGPSRDNREALAEIHWFGGPSMSAYAVQHVAVNWHVLNGFTAAMCPVLAAVVEDSGAAMIPER